MLRTSSLRLSSYNICCFFSPIFSIYLEIYNLKNRSSKLYSLNPIRFRYSIIVLAFFLSLYLRLYGVSRIFNSCKKEAQLSHAIRQKHKKNALLLLYSTNEKKLVRKFVFRKRKFIFSFSFLLDWEEKYFTFSLFPYKFLIICTVAKFI